MRVIRSHHDPITGILISVVELPPEKRRGGRPRGRGNRVPYPEIGPYTEDDLREFPEHQREDYDGGEV